MNGVWDNDKLIRVDMTALTVSIEDYPADWKYLGGRALSARILLDECDPDVTPWVRITSWYWPRACCQALRPPLRGVCQLVAKVRLPAG